MHLPTEGRSCGRCGKAGYCNKKRALHVIHTLHNSDDSVHPYQCSSGLWHVGH